MDNLNIDFNSLLPHVIDAFSSVYGEEYRSIISKKVNNTIIVQYHDFVGLSNYIASIKRCKVREFSIRFLEEIGIDVPKCQKSNYTKFLDSDIEKIVICTIGPICDAFSKESDYWSPLRAFNSTNTSSPEKLLENKIKIVNYLLGNEHEQITKENFESFSKTEEFLKLLEKISKFNIIYERLLSEYNEWANKLLTYEKYAEDEEKRENAILQEKKKELFIEIFDQLPSFVKDSISNKTFEEQQEILLGSSDISNKLDIEYFRHDKIEKLNSLDVTTADKFWILYYQSSYFKRLGINIPSKNNLERNDGEDDINYLLFLKQEDIKKYIPSDELINYISQTRERKYEEAIRQYYTTRKDFIDIMKVFDNNPNNIEYIYNCIKKQKVFVSACGGTNNDNNEFIHIMFYTIRTGDDGSLFYSFMHENGHIIDQNQKGCGFEIVDCFEENSIKNPYDNSLRKYEAFDEALNDIFTVEAIQFLQNKGIYLIEPKEFTSLDIINNNTSSITKNLLQPLVQRFRKQVIKAKISAEPDELIKYIGKDNFEDLVDAVNKVHYLSRNGVMPKIDIYKDDDMVIEYFKQVERVKQIYINIDNYYANNFGYLSTNDYDNSSKKR